jgi:glyoxylase I family protein
MPALHHVSIVTRDLDRSCAFYTDLIGLTRIPRPNFSTPGIWLQAGELSVHLILWPQGHFRARPVVDPADAHFALAVEDFDAVIDHLVKHGYTTDAASGDPLQLLVSRTGAAGFAQAYLLDPDWNIVELNAAQLTPSGLA